MKLFVGNLSFSTTENDLEDLFSQYGTVAEVGLVTDRATGRSRGFAFVTMGNASEAQAAITALDGKDFAGRNIAVNEARPKTDAQLRCALTAERGNIIQRRRFSRNPQARLRPILTLRKNETKSAIASHQ